MSTFLGSDLSGSLKFVRELYRVILRFWCRRMLCDIVSSKSARLCVRYSRDVLAKVYHEAVMLYNKVKGEIRQRCYPEAMLFVALLTFTARLLELEEEMEKYRRDLREACVDLDDECIGARYIMCKSLGVELNYRRLRKQLKGRLKVVRELNARSAYAELIKLALCSRESYRLPAAKCSLFSIVVSEEPHHSDAKQIVEMCKKIRQSITLIHED